MKMKYKLTLDLVLGLLFVGVMYYFITGNFLHEIISTVLLVGFFIHVIVNNKYYLSIFKKSKNGKKAPAKIVAGKITNIILLISAVLMTITSVVISNSVFSFLNINVQHYCFWRISHIVLAAIMVICVIVHLILHHKMIVAFFKKKKGVSVAMVIVIIVFSCLIAFGAFKPIMCLIETHNSNEIVVDEITTVPQTTQATTQAQAQESSTQAQTETTTEATTAHVTLEEYLAARHCGQCKKNCSLLNPQCSKGVALQKQATEEYHSIYG